MHWHEGNNSQFDGIQEKLSRVFQHVADNKHRRDFGVAGFRGKVLELLDQQADARRNVENKLMAMCEEKVSKLRSDIANESKTRFESIDQLKFSDNFQLGKHP